MYVLVLAWVYMYSGLYANVRICACRRMYVLVLALTCILCVCMYCCLYVYARNCVCSRMYVLELVHEHVFIFVCLCMYICLCVCVCVDACMLMHGLVLICVSMY
jgi:hypothetical protein